MKLLVVMINYPFPPRAGSMIVAYNSMKHLSKRHEIDLVCFQPEKGLVDPPEFIEQLVLIPHRQPPRIILLMHYLRYITAGVPPAVSVSAFVSPAMRKKVEELINLNKYDAILLFEMNAIQHCPPSCYRKKLIVHIEDPQSIKLSRLSRLSGISLLQRAKYYLLSIFTVSYENKILPMMGKVLLLSEADMIDLHKQGGHDNLACVPYGVDQHDSEKIVGYEGREKIIVFSGNMFHLPNVDGALFFLKDIFPLILKEYQSAILYIVGANPDNSIYKVAAKFGKQVVITGKVADVAHYIKTSTVSICPVRLKIGVQTKILEALSLGTPVVTTSAGNSGVAGLSGCHLWIEDDPYQFAKRVIELLQGSGWSNLSKEGRKFVREHFSWENSVAKLEQNLESLILKD